MLVFNPNNRISVDEALAHPYLKQLHNPKDEPECTMEFDFEFEKLANTKIGIQREILSIGYHNSLYNQIWNIGLMFEEILKFRPSAESPVKWIVLSYFLIFQTNAPFMVMPLLFVK